MIEQTITARNELAILNPIALQQYELMPCLTKALPPTIVLIGFKGGAVRLICIPGEHQMMVYN